MGVSVIRLRRLAFIVVGALLVLGLTAASAPSQSTEGDAEVQLRTAGPGTLTISPAQDGPKAACQTDAQEYGGESSEETCQQHYKPGTRVTLNAVPKSGRSFVGWSDFGCRNSSRRCTITAYAGTRYIAARFAPVTLRIMVNERDPEPYEVDPEIPHPFGLISVKPKPKKPCSFDHRAPCVYPLGTTVTLSGEYVNPDYFWIGACNGNDDGKLESKYKCRLRLMSNEVVGAGWKYVGDIPPQLGSGINVVVVGRGKVSIHVINRSGTLSCPPDCTVGGLHPEDYVRLKATAGNFYRWSNAVRGKSQTVSMGNVNRLQAVFH